MVVKMKIKQKDIAKIIIIYGPGEQNRVGKKIYEDGKTQ